MLKINNISKKRTKLYIATAAVLATPALVFAAQKNIPHATFAEGDSLKSVVFQDPNLCKSIYNKLRSSFSINNYCTETTPYLEMTEADILSVTSFEANGNEALGGYSAPITNLSGIENFTNLKRLNLISMSYNSITDISPLASLTNLEYLNLTDNPISDFSPLANLTKLTELDLDSTSISNLSPLANLTNLTNLRLDYGSISDLTPLSNLTHLEELWARSNNISDLSPLSSLTSLKTLKISHNSISSLTPLASLTSLTDLDFAYNQVPDLSALSNLTNLYRLDFSSNAIFDYTPIENILPSISSLDYGSQRATVETSNETYTLPAAFTQVRDAGWVGGKPHTNYDLILDNATLSDDGKKITFIDSQQPATVQIQYSGGTINTNDILTVKYVANSQNGEDNNGENPGTQNGGNSSEDPGAQNNGGENSSEADPAAQQTSGGTDSGNSSTSSNSSSAGSTSGSTGLSAPDTGENGGNESGATPATSFALGVSSIIATLAIIFMINKRYHSKRR